MGAHYNMGGAAALPLNLLAQAIPMLTRNELASLTERLIDYLDNRDGDPDIEPNGDELDGNDAEDDHGMGNWSVPRWTGPGDPISDPDMGAEDYAFDPEEDCCQAGDDGCGPIVMHGTVHWGSSDDAADRLRRPKYGIDQTKGPAGYTGGGYVW